MTAIPLELALLPEDRPSSRPDHRVGSTVREAATRVIGSLLKDLDTGHLDAESVYDVSEARVERFVLAGGGPGYELVFVLTDGDEISACYFGYYEPVGQALIGIDKFAAVQLRAALRRPAGR